MHRKFHCQDSWLSSAGKHYSYTGYTPLDSWTRLSWNSKMVSKQRTLIFPPRSCQHFSSGLARYDHIQPVTGPYTPTVEVGCLALPTQIPMHSWAPAWPRWMGQVEGIWGICMIFLPYDICMIWYAVTQKNEMIWHLYTFIIIFRYEWKSSADAVEFQLKIKHELIHSRYWYNMTWCANHFLSHLSCKYCNIQVASIAG